MANRYLNDFGKLLRFRSVHLLRKQFMNENKARRVRKKGAQDPSKTSESNQSGRGSCLACT